MEKCDKCGEDLCHTVSFCGNDFQFYRQCRCKREEEELYQRRKKLEEIKAGQEYCFGKSRAVEYTFDVDDKKMKNVSEASRRYAEKFDEMAEKNIGILFHGPVGSGKSFYAACIANKLIERGKWPIMTNFASVVNRLQESFIGREDYLKRLARVPLLIIDDFGIERSTEYMQEQVYNVIDTRYNAKKPLIITTNIPLEKITNPDAIGYERTFDRILEMCHPIKIETESRRREKAKEEYAKRKQILGV